MESGVFVFESVEDGRLAAGVEGAEFGEKIVFCWRKNEGFFVCMCSHIISYKPKRGNCEIFCELGNHVYFRYTFPTFPST